MSIERERLPFTLPFLNRRKNGSNSRSGQLMPGSDRCLSEQWTALEDERERSAKTDQWDR